MKVKCLEIRDIATFIAALCVDMNPGEGYPANGSMSEQELKDSLEARIGRLYLLRRCGYPCDGLPNIMVTKLMGDGSRACNDPYYWGDRTWVVAHNYIIEHWNELKDGDVVDVQFILGETASPKISERVSA